MHETGVAREIVERALAEVADGHGRVKTLRVSLGPSHVDADALAFSIQAMCFGTRAEGARVVVTTVHEPGVILKSVETEEAS